MKTRFILITGASALVAVGSALLILQTAHSQPPGQGARQTGTAADYTPEVKIEVRDGYRYITSNGIPDHKTGRFPNNGNPNAIAPQNYHYRVPLTPKIAERAASAPVFGPQLFGVAINGVPFDPGTAELWNGDFRWRYEALSGFLFSRGGLGVDENLAHVQPNGAYHYHGLPFGLLNKLDYQHKMALVGYAADGFPIYGPYAYSDPNNSRSALKLLKASYRIKNGARPGGADGPGGAYDGSFAQDYEFVKGAGDLDTSNGRQGVTPEYPNGTYFYVLTDNWPFVPRQFKGAPDGSFSKQGPGGPGAPGGPGGFGGPGAGQGGQFGQGGRPPFGGQGGQAGPGGQGGRPPFGGPGGPPPFGGPGGPPRGMVPGAVLTQYLGLNKEQADKLDHLMKTMDALGQENFAVPAFAQLKLTDAQIRKIGDGGKVSEVLTAAQKKVLNANKRPGFGGPGGPGGPGGFGGGPGGPGGGPGQGGPPPQEQ